MDATDDAWAAGFLDGEGCFAMYKEIKANGYLQVRTHVSANQAVFPQPTQRLRELFGGTWYERGNRTSTGKRVFQWQISGNDGQRAMLERIIPYMIVKRPYAELFLELAQYKGNHYGRGGNPYHEEWLRIYAEYASLRQRYHNVGLSVKNQVHQPVGAEI